MTLFELAEQYVATTHVSLFLTGRAGTGKTTFLRHIVGTVQKRCVVLAPTGVAAINAGGVTIHSFFQLPLCPYLPDVKELVTEYQMPAKTMRLRKERINLIRTLDLIIIDEISMVRADLLDAVDYTLRRYRRSAKPFGGVQLLMIGDVQQLPPVVTDAEKPYMDQVYPSPFFFHSKALQKINYVTIELQHIYRQRDSLFIEMLNNIRDNRFDEKTLRTLNERLQPKFDPDDKEGYIRLTTHNYQANHVNQHKLDALPDRPVTLKAEIQGSFPESAYPTDQQLVLKKGAQVMFVKNDTEGAYYNGKIATVEGYDPEQGVAVVDKEGNHMVVGRSRWENLKYEIDPQSNEIKQQVDGTFDQYPLRLAWAITIHKSQGLTFDKVIIDASQAFTYGQVYVALSRCRSLEGLVLSSPISSHCAFDNADIVEFNQSIPSVDTVEHQLGTMQSSYFFEVLNELFDFSALGVVVDRLNDIYQQHLRNVYPTQVQRMSSFCNNDVTNVVQVSERFRKQLRDIALQTGGDIHSARLQERVGKAVAYFAAQLEQLGETAVTLLEVESDNKTVARDLKEHTNTFLETLGLAQRMMKRVGEQGFSVELYHTTKCDYLLEHEKNADERPARKKGAPKASVPQDLRHPLVAVSLIQWRRGKAADSGVPAFHILTQKTVFALADALPLTYKQLLRVKGMGKVNSSRFGEDILAITRSYAASKGMDVPPLDIESF